MLDLIDPNSRTLYERYKSKQPFDKNLKKEEKLTEKDESEIKNIENIEKTMNNYSEKN